MAKNRIKQDEVEKMIQANYVKRASHIINRGVSYYNILFTVANLLSVTNTTEGSTESIIQAILPLSSDTLKDDFIHMGGNIGYLPNLKK